MQFTHAFINDFVKSAEFTSKELRTGQAFYNWAKLHKIQNTRDKDMCDIIHSLDGKEFWSFIAAFVYFD